MELLIDETTADGEPLGEMFLDLYNEYRFNLFNPPEAIILQNKSFMSLVYALYLTNQFFTGPERDIIKRYLTPSYFESDFPNLGDQASAVGCRFSPEEIAGTEAYFVPLLVE